MYSYFNANKEIVVKFLLRLFSVELRVQVTALERCLQEEKVKCREERVRRRLLHNTLVVRTRLSALIHCS